MVMRNGNVRRGNSAVPVVAITGGIGSGKSIVARVFENMGAYLIDADMIGRSVLENNEAVREKIVMEFGENVQDQDGRISRSLLGNAVFADHRKLQTLNNIIHPAMIKIIKDEVASALNSGEHRMIVVDAALIFEAGVESCFDFIVTVRAGVEERIRWLGIRNPMTREAIVARIRSQFSEEEKASRSQFVIENDSTVEELRLKAGIVFNSILRSG